MKPARIAICALMLIAPITYLVLQAKPRPTSAEEEIKNFEQKANAAYEANDLPKYFSFYAGDFSQFQAEGRQDHR
jgi:hypothetical protein